MKGLWTSTRRQLLTLNKFYSLQAQKSLKNNTSPHSLVKLSPFKFYKGIHKFPRSRLKVTSYNRLFSKPFFKKTLVGQRVLPVT
jgi:hypothetical protein